MKIWPKCQDVCREESNIGECQEEGRKGVNIDRSEGVDGARRAGGARRGMSPRGSLFAAVFGSDFRALA